MANQMGNGMDNGVPENETPGQDQSKDPQEIITEVQNGLMELAQLFGSSDSVPPADKQKLGLVLKAFDDLVNGGQPQAPAQGSPEAGMNPNAQPMQ